MDRRQFLFAGAGGFASALCMSRRARAQAGNVSIFARGGTNVVALAEADGAVLVDSGGPDASEPFPARVKTVFNTHYHADNTAGNAALRDAGAEIIAHEMTKQWMAVPTWLPAEDRYRQPRPKNARPTKTFYTTGSMTAGSEHIEYGYLIEAHTSGDIYVFFRDSNVLAVGDVASPARDPELDWLTGAWLGGRVDALTRLIKMCDANTRVVPTFGPVITRVELQAEHDVMKTLYDRAVDRVRQGDSPDDMLAAGLLKDLPRTWNDPKKFAYAVHKGMWAHHNKLNANIV